MVRGVSGPSEEGDGEQITLDGWAPACAPGYGGFGGRAVPHQKGNHGGVPLQLTGGGAGPTGGG